MSTWMAAETGEAPSVAKHVALDPIALLLDSSGILMVVLWGLIVAALAVWFIAVVKRLQLGRLARAEGAFEREAAAVEDGDALIDVARQHDGAPGARVVIELSKRRQVPKVLEGVAKRALVEEEKRASSLMSILGSIGAASPFVGLFGTVWGIMDAFLRIGREKSASLPVVAPAIGEALIATAIGLFAAIPAVIFYNALSKRIEELLSGLEASSESWVALVATEPLSLSIPSHFGSPGAVGISRTPGDLHRESHPVPLQKAHGSGRPPPLPGM